jgi:hypothetical protein
MGYAEVRLLDSWGPSMTELEDAWMIGPCDLISKAGAASCQE